MLHVVMYHHVRDLPQTRYPNLRATPLDDFRRQVNYLALIYEMATLESCIDFLKGKYRPTRDLCLLTFDDGLKEHYRDITPLLEDLRIEGVFSLITGCVESRTVAPVHMNHLLMAQLDFETYQQAFLLELADRNPELLIYLDVDALTARASYPWDTPETACFKYFFNFVLDAGTRDRVVRRLFREYAGDEREVARELYVTWQEARAMQSAGMIIAGRSHRHRSLASLDDGELRDELSTCRALMDRYLAPQPAWPFSYPYGKRASFRESTVSELQRLGFDCAFTTEAGPNPPGADLYGIRRIDSRQAPRQVSMMAVS